MGKIMGRNQQQQHNENIKSIKLVKDVARTVTRQLIELGLIESNYDNFHDLSVAVRKSFHKLDFEHYIVNHEDDILETARNNMDCKNYTMACISYAIWTEHFINGFILQICERNNIDESCGIGLIRKCNIEDKYSWILKLLVNLTINKNHYNNIVKLNGFRNYFIHYKWQSVDDAFMNEMIKSVSCYSKTVIYLRKLKSKYLFNGNKTKIDKLFKRETRN
jgi:hypothetical protein